jgi:hypothetical protein
MTKTTRSHAEPFRTFAIRDSIFFRLADFALRISVLVFTASVVCADEGTDFFEAKIRPVLVEPCYQCHSAQAANAGKLKGGLQLDTRAGIHMGGDSGPAVVPGMPEVSLLPVAGLLASEFPRPESRQRAARRLRSVPGESRLASTRCASKEHSAHP